MTQIALVPSTIEGADCDRSDVRRNRHAHIAENILDLIGNTPLLRLKRYLDDPSVTLFAKLEYANPGGSAKDRPALEMLRNAFRRGDLTSSSTVVESSSGNMGIGLAQACKYFGLPFVCVADRYAQAENLAIIKAFGGIVDTVEQATGGSYLAARLERVRSILKSNPLAYWPNQYANRNNPYAHKVGTMREIDNALGGAIDYLFVATSSTGTARGCRDYLRENGRTAQIICVDSTGSVLFGGALSKRNIPGLGAGVEPQLAQGQTFDDLVRVSDLDCVIGCRRAADREAILVGGSAGGVLESVRKMQRELSGKTCVVILHDSGTRYLSTVFCDSWVQETLGVGPDKLNAHC